jgi:hypothetical protein
MSSGSEMLRHSRTALALTAASPSVFVGPGLTHVGPLETRSVGFENQLLPENYTLHSRELDRNKTFVRILRRILHVAA